MTEETLFLLALDKPADERATFLDSACMGDDTLRLRVEELLRAHHAPSDFLDEPAIRPERFDGWNGELGAWAGNETPSVSAVEGLGSWVGPYRLIEPLGEGGMGVVFKAEQIQPVQRTVALKIIKPGMDSRAIIARFEAERQALARMDHPNIAKVLDAGATASGRPYFVMELVQGVPITKYCGDHSYTSRQRLELFIPVCQAVQHAHQKGIIHRDLKPSNVLVTQYDDKPVAKVIDFGIARATERNATVQTEAGMLVGTPAYMSPEQTDATSQDVDTRSDIYSLGVVLYELLSGETPFAMRAAGVPVFEVLRMIREVDPPAPSALSKAASKKEISPELDWITLKCLEKDRSRRYDTAAALAEDIQRFLEDEPVLAGPLSKTYRLRKFVRRNRGKVLAASIILATLIAGIIGTAAGLVRATFAESQAKIDRDEAISEKKRADLSTEIAQEVAEFLQNDVLRQADPEAQADRGETINTNLSVREALDRAAARIDQRFHDKPLVEAAIRMVIGDAYLGIGQTKPAVVHLERSLELRRTLLGPDDSETLHTSTRLAKAYTKDGRTADAIRLMKDSIPSWMNNRDATIMDFHLGCALLADAYHGALPLSGAIKFHEEMLEAQKAHWGPEHPDTIESINNLAIAYSRAERAEEAISLFEHSQRLWSAQLGPDHPRTLLVMNDLANAYKLAHRFTDALSLREETVRRSITSRGEDHPETLNCVSGLGMDYLHAGRASEGLALLEKTFGQQKAKHGLEHPRTIRAIWQLAIAHAQSNARSQADALYREALDLHRKIDPESREATILMVQLGQNLMHQQRFTEAESILRASLEIRDRRYEEDWRTFEARLHLGKALLGQQRFTEAEPLLLTAHERLHHQQNVIPPALRTPLLNEAQRGVVELYETWGKRDIANDWRSKAPPTPQKH